MLRKLAFTSALAFGGLATPAFAAEHYVLMVGNGYFPPTIHASAGDTIRFVNMSSFPMSAVATDGSWDTGTLMTDGEYVLPVTAGMTTDYANGVLDNTDGYGMTVGADASGTIDLINDANTSTNSVTGEAWTVPGG